MDYVSEMLDKGGPILKVLLALSVAGLAGILYCLMVLRRQVLLPQSMIRDLQQADPDSLTRLCEAEGGPFAEVLLTVLATRDAGREEAEALIEASGRRAVHELGRGPLLLEVVAAISPLLGLLGTVTGMTSAFGAISQTGVKNMSELSLHISEALYTTIAGLAIAIPAYVAFTWFNRRVDSLVLEMERHALALMARVRGNQPAQAPQKAASAVRSEA